MCEKSVDSGRPPGVASPALLLGDIGRPRGDATLVRLTRGEGGCSVSLADLPNGSGRKRGVVGDIDGSDGEAGVVARRKSLRVGVPCAPVLLAKAGISRGAIVMMTVPEIE
jgi:hypothetical protein